MMEELPDINSGLLRPDLFAKFREQLKKDFVGSGLNGDFAMTLEQDYDLIFKKVIDEIDKAGRTAHSKLTGLLYRIDVSELQIKKLSREKPENEMNEIMAELIIKRELQKVVIKEHYRNK
jgi:hypothetical protein